MAAVAAVLAVAVILVMTQPHAQPTPSGAMVVEVLSTGVEADGHPLASGTRLPAGAAISALGDATLRLLSDGSELSLIAGTRLRLGAGEVRAYLEQGRIIARVRPQGGGRFTITGPQASVTVLGTVFTLDANGTTTHLAVDEGLVRFAPLNGGAVDVAAGATADANVHGQSGPVRGFALIDAGRDVPLGASTLGRLAIAHSAMPAGGISLRVDCAPDIRALRFDVQGPKGPVKGVVDLERVVPFSLTGDTDGDFKPWYPSPGTYRITVLPYLDDDGRQLAGSAAVLVLTIAP